MKIFAMTLISNKMTTKGILNQTDNVQQQIIFEKDKVHLKRYGLKGQLVETGNESYDCDCHELFELFENYPFISMPIQTSYDAQWELIIKCDEGYKWIQGKLDNGLEINGINMTKYVQQLLHLEDIMVFG